VIVPLFGVLFRRGDGNALQCLAGTKIGNETRDDRCLIGATTRRIVVIGGGVQQYVLWLEIVVDHVTRVHAVQAEQNVQEDCETNVSSKCSTHHNMKFYSQLHTSSVVSVTAANRSPRLRRTRTSLALSR